jgi:hypothetical protein
MTAKEYEKFYKDVQIHFEMLCTDEIRAHAYADISHDLAFQIFRVLGGYRQALEELATQRAQWEEERSGLIDMMENMIAELEQEDPMPDAPNYSIHGIARSLRRLYVIKFRAALSAATKGTATRVDEERDAHDAEVDRKFAEAREGK